MILLLGLLFPFRCCCIFNVLCGRPGIFPISCFTSSLMRSAIRIQWSFNLFIFLFFFIYVSFVSVAENEHSNLNNTLLANYCANDCFVFALAGWWTRSQYQCVCVCLRSADCVCGMIRGWNQNDDFCPFSFAVSVFYWAIYFGRGIQDWNSERS